ncbi:MAG: hypothetical protein WBW33_05290 [Bryobacteraceae bacterium]
MPTDQDLTKKEESIQDQAAATELENHSDELTPEDAEKVTGGAKGIGEQ